MCIHFYHSAHACLHLVIFTCQIKAVCPCLSVSVYCICVWFLVLWVCFCFCLCFFYPIIFVFVSIFSCVCFFFAMSRYGLYAQDFLLEYVFVMRVSSCVSLVCVHVSCVCMFLLCLCVHISFLCMCLYFFYLCVSLLRLYVQLCLCVFSCHFAGIHITFMCLSMFLLFVCPRFLSVLMCLSASVCLCFFSICVSCANDNIFCIHFLLYVNLPLRLPISFYMSTEFLTCASFWVSVYKCTHDFISAATFLFSLYISLWSWFFSMCLFLVSQWLFYVSLFLLRIHLCLYVYPYNFDCVYIPCACVSFSPLSGVQILFLCVSLLLSVHKF